MEADSASFDDFREEIRTSRIQRHPCVVHFFGFGFDSDRRPFIVMEYLSRGVVQCIYMVV